MADSELTVGDHIKQEIQRRVLMADKAHERGKKYIMIDIDGTICKTPGNHESANDQLGFREAIPYEKRIEYLNKLYDEGHFLHYWTARGCWDGEDYLQETREQLDSWGVKYNDVAVFKPLYDIWIDDKAIGVDREEEGFEVFKKQIDDNIPKTVKRGDSYHEQNWYKEDGTSEPVR
mgnify:FL=1